MSLWNTARVFPFFLAGCTLFFSHHVIVVGGEALAQDEGEPPINITSDQMEYLSEKNFVIFTGNAHAVRDDITLSADKMEVTFVGEDGDDRGEGSVRRIVATGNVNVRQTLPATRENSAPKERYATGDKGEYDGDARTVTLTGSPRLWEGKNIITGDVMIFYIDEHRFVVKGKVRMSIFPEKDLEKK